MIEASQAAMILGRMTTDGLEALKSVFAKPVKVTTKETAELVRLRAEVTRLREDVRRLEKITPRRLSGGGLIVPAQVQFETEEQRIQWFLDQAKEPPIEISLPDRFNREV